jgi:hypothetical protein
MATGLIGRVLWDGQSAHAAARANLPGHMARLPPALALVLSSTEGVVGGTILTR